VIGANDGKFSDPLYPLMSTNAGLRDNSKVLLVEPQAQLIP
jgi:hypothetical protein